MVKVRDCGTVLTPNQAFKMADDAKEMDQDTWCKKYPIGDYQQYRNWHPSFWQRMATPPDECITGSISLKRRKVK